MLGIPIDATDLAVALILIETAVSRGKPFFISTPNLNFLVNSRSNPEFRESLLDSDCCFADGVPLVWISYLMGMPIKNRVSGSDIFEALKASNRSLKVFLFGGEEGVATAACTAINAASGSLSCVGALYPGFVTVEDMSRDEFLDRVNASQADFLVAALGSMKGQLWLHRNHSRITVPLRAHLGAVMNFTAGTVKRAPRWLRARGLEWLWRIKEEPHLWRRYTNDGLVLLRLLFARVLPLVVINRWYRLKSKWNPKELRLNSNRHHDSVTVMINGDADQRNIATAVAGFRETLKNQNSHVVIDLSGARVIDGRFLGLLLMVRKRLKGQGTKLTFIGISATMRRLFWLNEVDFLITNAIEKA